MFSVNFKKIIHFFDNDIFYISILIIIAILCHWDWFTFGTELSFWDFPYHSTEALKELIVRNTWLSNTSLGELAIELYKWPLIALYSCIGLFFDLSFSDSVRIVYLIPVSIIGFLSPYIFLRYLTKNSYISFVCALFYGSSVFLTIFKYLGHISIAFVSSCAPLLLYFFIKSFNNNNRRSWIIFLLLFCVGFFYEARMMYVFCFLLFSYLLLNYNLIKNRLKSIFLIIILFFLLNLFWILPILLGNYSNQIGDVVGRDLNGSGFYSIVQSLALFNHAWTEEAFTVFNQQPILWYFWLAPFVVYLSFVFRFKSADKKLFIYFSILYLVGLFLTKQDSAPFSEAFQLLRDYVPGFEVFRSCPKFYFLLIFGCTGILSLFLLNLYSSRYKFYKGLGIVLSVIIVVNAFFNLKPLLSHDIPGMFSEKFIVSDYIKLNKLLTEQEVFFRTLWVPFDSRWGVALNNKPKINNSNVFSSSWESVVDLSGDPSIDAFSLDYFNYILDISSVKYLIIPFQDDINNDNVFKAFGKTHDWYVSRFDSIHYLEKIYDSYVTVYENNDFKPYFYTLNNVYCLNNIKNINSKILFLQNKITQNLGFVERNNAESKDMDKLAYVTDFSDDTAFDLYGKNNVVSDDNLFINGSFESGLWHNIVQDCHNYDNNPMIFMNLAAGGTHGLYSLELESVRHTACSIKKGISVMGGSYILEFDYRGNQFGKAGYYIAFDDAEKTVIADKLKTGVDWVTFKKEIKAPKDAQSMTIYVYSYPDDGNNHAVVWYDNFRLYGIKNTQSLLDVNFSLDKYKNSKVFFRNNSNELYYTKNDKEIVVYWGNNSVFRVNDDKQFIGKNIVNIKNKNNKAYYIIIVEKNDESNIEEVKYKNRIILLEEGSQKLLKRVNGDVFVEIYSVDLGDNIISNYSFEAGSWQDKVGDCHNYDDNPVISMMIDSKAFINGEKSLNLKALKHDACIKQKISVSPGNYLFSMHYRVGLGDAGFYLKLDDANETVLKDRINAINNSWNNVSYYLNIPEGVSLADLYLYAYELNGIEESSINYDNLFLGKVSLEKRLVLRKESLSYGDIDMVFDQEDVNLSYYDFDYVPMNIFPNGSFEDGSWQEKVDDCHNYDDNRILAMSLNKEKKTDGEQSLQLEAARHVACVSKGIPIEGGRNYILKFDYQSDDSKTAGYYVAFDNPEKTKFSEKIKIEGTDWKTFEKNIKVPEGSKKMTIFIYAYPTDNVTNNVVRYDNFQLIQLPDLEDRFYLVSEPKEKLVEPRETNFDLINPTKKLVHIKGATTPFFLAMSESYHPQWELQMNNEKIQGLLDSWWPFAKREKVGEEYHYKLANFLNAWYVDVPELCKDGNKACTKNEDGSYDIELVVEFWPQRWFYLGLLISGTTLVGCVGYLGYDFVRSRKRKKKDLVLKK